MSYASGFCQFNLNDHVYVELSEDGLAYLEQAHAAMLSNSRLTMAFKPPEKFGKYYKMQVFDFMEAFGSVSAYMCPKYINNMNVLLRASDLKSAEAPEQPPFVLGVNAVRLPAIVRPDIEVQFYVTDPERILREIFANYETLPVWFVSMVADGSLIVGGNPHHQHLYFRFLEKLSNGSDRWVKLDPGEYVVSMESGRKEFRKKDFPVQT